MDGPSKGGDEPTGYAEQWRKQRLHRAQPFVGFEGVGCKLGVVEEQGALRITGSNSNYFWIILGLLGFGPGLNVLAFLEWETFAQKHWVILGIVCAFSIFAWAFLLKYIHEVLFGRPLIDAPFGGNTLLLRRGGSPRPFREFDKSDIERFAVVESVYRSDSEAHLNFTVRLTTRDGDTIDLCTSDNRDQVETIGRKLADRFKVPLELSSQAENK